MPQTNISNIIYTYKYIQNMYPKVGPVEEKTGGRKEEKKVNNKIYHIYIGTKHNENC
jgi:hypothetical protein